VQEWISRLKLCKHDVYLAIKTFTEAIQTIDAQQAVGKASIIWIEFAHFYEEYGELENANVILHRASQTEFRSVEELAAIYCAWSEMHIRHGNIDSALSIMKYACSKSGRGRQGKGGSLVNNIRAWSLYLDLLESCGTYDQTKMAYEKVLELRIATP